MNQSIIWTKEESISGGKVGHYRGVIVEKTKHHYWIYWSENVSWAAPHSKMSDGLRSSQSAKRMIDRLLEREKTDLSIIVRRYNELDAKALWARRGYNRLRLVV